MTEKEFKKLKKYQILELMVMQSEKIEQLEKQLKEAQSVALEKEMKIKELGSIAQACLELNEVFTAAQKAADDYIEEAKKKADEIIRCAKNEIEVARICDEINNKSEME